MAAALPSVQQGKWTSGPFSLPLAISLPGILSLKTANNVAIKIYSNADTLKSQILKDNKDKSGIYRPFPEK